MSLFELSLGLDELSNLHRSYQSPCLLEAKTLLMCFMDPSLAIPVFETYTVSFISNTLYKVMKTSCHQYKVVLFMELC